MSDAERYDDLLYPAIDQTPIESSRADFEHKLQTVGLVLSPSLAPSEGQEHRYPGRFPRRAPGYGSLRDTPHWILWAPDEETE